VAKYFIGQWGRVAPEKSYRPIYQSTYKADSNTIIQK